VHPSRRPRRTEDQIDLVDQSRAQEGAVAPPPPFSSSRFTSSASEDVQRKYEIKLRLSCGDAEDALLARPAKCASEIASDRTTTIGSPPMSRTAPADLAVGSSTAPTASRLFARTRARGEKASFVDAGYGLPFANSGAAG
jgi:hypothetical protein